MKETLQKLYGSHKTNFEFSGVILVITGLFLNIPNPHSAVGSTTLHYVKFFLLFLACLIVGYLVCAITRDLLDYILEDADRSNFGGTVSGLQKQIDFLVKKVLMATFLLMIAVLMLVNLFLFLFDVYTTELFFVTLISASYFIAYKSSRFVDKLSFLGNSAIYIYISWMLLLILAVPLLLIIILYFGMQNEIVGILREALETLSS